MSSREVRGSRPIELANRLALSPKEAAAALGVSENHFRDRVMRDLPVVRSGNRVLIPRGALETWLHSRAETGVDRADAVVAELLGQTR